MEGISCINCDYGDLSAADPRCKPCNRINGWVNHSVNQPTEGTMEGVKYDQGKPMLSLIGYEFIRVLWFETSSVSMISEETPEFRLKTAKLAYLAVNRLSEPRNMQNRQQWFKHYISAVHRLAAVIGPSEMLRQCAVAMGPNGGMSKYGHNNWRLGMTWDRLLDAAQRHLLAYIDGNEIDEETTANHVGNAAFCLQCIADFWVGDVGAEEFFKTGDASTWLLK